MSIIEVRNLLKTFKVKQKINVFKDIFQPEYKEVEAVKDLTFSIEEGEAVAFLGPNGAGKTTTAKMLTGLIYPTSGSVKVLGFEPFEKKKEFLTNIGLVMGNKSGLNWDLTPRQNLEILKSIYQINEANFNVKVNDLVELLNTKFLMDTQVRNLSLGERMKFELIRSIIHSPKVLLLDEPTIGLDIIAKQKVREFLKHIQKEFKVTLLLTSHDMADIENVCDRVLIINHGLKVYDNDLVELKSQYSQMRYVKFIFTTLPETIEKEIAKDYKVNLLEKDDISITYEMSNSIMPNFIAQIGSKYTPEDIEIITTPLEKIITDIFEK